MRNFSPPLRDIRFITHEVLAAVPTLREIRRYAQLDEQTLDSVAAEAGRFCAERIAPINAAADSVGCRWRDGEVQTAPGFQQAFHEYVRLGWPVLGIEERLGGQGLPRIAFSSLNEMVAAASHAFVMISAINHCAVACLQGSAAPTLQQRWLPEIVSGQVLTSMCMSEPQAGSDLGLIRTRAVLRPDGSYGVRGSKIFASGAQHDLSDNIVHLVLARVDGAPAGTRGLSLFLVPKLLDGGQSNQLACTGIEHKMGLHGSPTCGMYFDDAQGWLVGELHGGLKALFPMMNEARLLSGLQAVGIGEAALQAAQQYACDRRQGRAGAGAQEPSRLVCHADVQRMLLTQKAWTEGARALAYWVAMLIDEAQLHPDDARRHQAAELLALLTPVVKGFLTENAQHSTSLGLQVFGGHGYIAETGVEQLVRDVRVTTIYEGTTGMQAQDLLMRKVLQDGGRRLQLLLGCMGRWMDAVDGAHAVQPYLGQVRELQSRLLCVTRHLQARHDRRPESVHGASAAYLRLMGHAVLSWLWARMARQAMDAEPADAWYAMKARTAGFYFTQLLGETLALEQAALADHEDCAGLLESAMA